MSKTYLKSDHFNGGGSDGLLEVFYKRAIEGIDCEAAICVVKILERRALLLGLDSPQKLDIIQVQAEQAPSSYEKLYAAIMALNTKSH